MVTIELNLKIETIEPASNGDTRIIVKNRFSDGVLRITTLRLDKHEAKQLKITLENLITNLEHHSSAI